MKTTFTAKIVFESDRFVEDGEDIDTSQATVFTMRRFMQLINDPNTPNLTIECILSRYSHEVEPTIIIREK